MVETEKYSSNRKIITDGTIITWDAENGADLKINFQNKFHVALRWMFPNDGKEKKLKIEIEDDNTMIFYCNNFNNSLGTGTSRPIEFATVDGRKTFIHFWVYRLGGTGTRKIEYCVYQEES